MTLTGLPVYAADLFAASIVIARAPTFTFTELEVEAEYAFVAGVKSADIVADASTAAGVQLQEALSDDD